MFCPFCGKENVQEAVFCHICGKKLLDEKEVDAPIQQKEIAKEESKVNPPLPSFDEHLYQFVKKGFFISLALFFIPSFLIGVDEDSVSSAMFFFPIGNMFLGDFVLNGNAVFQYYFDEILISSLITIALTAFVMLRVKKNRIAPNHIIILAIIISTIIVLTQLDVILQNSSAYKFDIVGLNNIGMGLLGTGVFKLPTDVNGLTRGTITASWVWPGLFIALFAIANYWKVVRIVKDRIKEDEESDDY